MDEGANPKRAMLDRVGLTISSLCLVHCILSIVLVTGLGFASQFLLAPEIHEYGLIIAVLVAAIAIGWGALNHRRPAPIIVALIGLSFMAGALTMPHDYREMLMTIVGVGCVAFAHILNMRGDLHQPH